MFYFNTLVAEFVGEDRMEILACAERLFCRDWTQRGNAALRNLVIRGGGRFRG